MDVPDEMVQAMSARQLEVLSVEGVRGMDIGLDGDGQLAIRILVVDPDDPPGGLPDFIEDFPVIVIAGDPIIEQGVVSDTIRHEPVFGGIQLGPDTVFGGTVQAGTLGCVFRDVQSGQPVAVSNAHVLCGFTNQFVHQPAPSTDPPSTFERLGPLLRCKFPTDPTFLPAPGRAPVTGVFDSAVCSVSEGRTGLIGEVADIGTVIGIGSPRLGDRVRKRGYRTLLTHGVVEGLFGAYEVRDPNGNPLWWLVGQVCIAMLPDLGLNPEGIWSNSGDSGSVVVNDTNEVVAQHWGGDNNGRGYATDFSTLAFALGVTL